MPDELREPLEVGEARDDGRRLYKARRPDGEVAWVDHEELWRLQQAQAAELRRRHARRRRLLLLTLLGLVAVALVLAVLRLRAPLDSAPRVGPVADERVADEPVPDEPGAARPERIAGKASARGESSTPPAAAEAAGPAAGDAADVGAGAPRDGQPAAIPESAPPADPDPGTEAAEPAAPEPAAAEQVAAAVRAWAAAWARRDVTAYLGSYAAGFEPPEGGDRAAWEGQRRRRLLGPTSIRVEIEALEVTVGDGGRAEARFVQSYDSPTYSDVVRKRLLLVEERGDWRIVSERASPL